MHHRIAKGDRYNIFLDDERHPWKVTWMSMPEDLPMKIIRNYKQFVGMITKCGLPEFISFDHDLASEHYAIGAPTNWQEFDYTNITEGTGMCCAKWLVEYCMEHDLPLPKWQTHSKNPCGCDNINGLLGGFKKFQDAVKAGEEFEVLP